jgi:GAF domain-containing protein
MFEAISRFIEERGEALACEWLAELERRGNVLGAAANRRQLWNDAKTWISLLLRAMRTDDLAPLERASRLTARRLAVAGLPAADAAEAILSFKAVLWRALEEMPGFGGKQMLVATRQLAEWFETAALSMVKHHGSVAQSDGSRSAIVDRAKRLSRMAEEESAVSHLAQEMASERDTRRLLRLVARSAAHLVGAQRAALAVREGDALRYRGTYRLPISSLNSYVKRCDSPLTGPFEPPELARIIPDLLDGADGARARTLQKLDLRCALRVPIHVGGRDVALLELFDPIAVQPWTERDVELVQELAAQGALAIENSRLLAATERRAQELTALNEIGRGFASQLSVPRLVSLAAGGAARLLRAQSALVWLRLPGSRRFELKAAYGADAYRGATSFDLGEGPLGEIAAGGAALILSEVWSALSSNRCWAIGAPLHIGGLAQGLVVAQRQQGPFDDDDLRMLEALGGQLSAALQNAKLYEQSRALGHRLNASIAALGEALAAALDMQELSQVVADNGAELADAAAAIIFIEDEGGRLAVRATAVRDEEVAADPQAYERLAALAVERGETIVLSARDKSAAAALCSVMAKDRVRACYAFPLTVRGRAAGALCILKRGSALRPQERELLSSFSRHAAVGIENVLLFGETQQRLAELADLSRASAGVSSTLDQTAIVEIVVESLSRALRVPVAAIVLLDAGGGFYLPDGGHRGVPPSFVRRFAVGCDSIACSVIADQRIKVISDIASEGRGEDSLIQGLGLGSVICAPLKGREGVLGVLFAADRLPRTFRPHEEALMSAYANEAALALQNAFHHQAVAAHARELEGILDATKTLSSTLELQPVLDHLASAAASLLGVPACSIMLLDDRGERLATVAACGLARDHPLHADLQARESIRGTVALRGELMTSTDLARDGRFKRRGVARDEGLRSMLAVPLTVKGKSLGVISVFSRSAERFTGAQERLLTTLAAEAGVAIENARLYAEAREQARSMRQLMEEVDHRIKNNLQSIIGIIQLHMAQAEEPQVREVLREVTGRVQAIAVAHELLFEEDMRAIDVKETSRRILDNALRANPNPGLKISGQVTGARVRLPSRKATPLASVVNEVVYNAVMHAFGGREQGNIAISFQEATGGQILVQVSDDGVGLPEGFDLSRDAKLGLRIAEGLVTRDLGGEFSIASNGGTIARVTFER